MSQMPPSASSSSNFQASFYLAVQEYKKMTKKNILADPLMSQLQTCKSPTDILAVLRPQVQQLQQSTYGDDKLTKWLTPTVNVLYAFSGVLGAGVGLVKSYSNDSSANHLSDALFLGFPTRECDICWCRCPPLGR